MNRLALFSGIFKSSNQVCARCRYASVLHAKRASRSSPLSQGGLRHRFASEGSANGEKTLGDDVPPEEPPPDESSTEKPPETEASAQTPKPKPKSKSKSKSKSIAKPKLKAKPKSASKSRVESKSDPKSKSKSKPNPASRRRSPAIKAKGSAATQRKSKIPKDEATEEEAGQPFTTFGSSISTVLGADALHANSAVEINGPSLKLEVVPVEQPAVPRLAHGLDRVLFNPGVTHVRDPRSRVYNFDPHLEKLMPVENFDFNSLTLFTPPSKDEVLARIAQESRKKYVASTSSMTGTLKHFHYLLSRWRPPNFTMLSKSFPTNMTTFTKMTRAPDAVFLRWRDGVYAVDADKMYDSANVLSLMGRYMEKLLTVDQTSFDRHRVGSSNPITEEERSEPEAFHYSTHGDFLLRSQLDAQDSRLPGTGMFDLKTRAVVPIRMDSSDYQWGMDYEIRSLLGEWQSFEREYHDMIRSTMMKYSLQVRMGRMDGIFMAYHNIARIFGFQYVSIEEMDRALHGQWDRSLGDQEFLHSLKLMNDIFDRATAAFPEQTLRFHFETRDSKRPFMYIFAEPVSEDEADEIQNTNKERIRLWEEAILSGRAPEETIRKDTGGAKVGDAAVQDSGTDIASSALQKDSAGGESQAESSDGQLEASSPSAEEGSSSAEARKPKASNLMQDAPAPTEPLLAMVLDIESFVNGRSTYRPNKFSASDEWNVKYHLVNVDSNEKAWTLYRACKLRRHVEMSAEEKRKDNEDDYFRRMLRRITSESRDWRRTRDQRDREAGLEGVVRMWNEDEASDSLATPYQPKNLPLQVRSEQQHSQDGANAASSQTQGGGELSRLQDARNVSDEDQRELQDAKNDVVAILTAYGEGDTRFSQALGEEWVKKQAQGPDLDIRVQALLNKQTESRDRERAAREAAYDLITETNNVSRVHGRFDMKVWKGVMKQRDDNMTPRDQF